MNIPVFIRVNTKMQEAFVRQVWPGIFFTIKQVR